VLHRSLHHLQAAEYLAETRLRPERVYTFKHPLTQEVAYQSLRHETRQHYHAYIAQVLAAQCPDTVAAQPALVAHHYTAAGLGTQAIPYWQQAGQQALAHSANAEAIRHLTQGLETLKALPITPERRQQELHLLLTLAIPLKMLKGNLAPDVEHIYTRVLELCHQMEDSPQRFAGLMGFWWFVLGLARYRMAHELATQCFALAQRLHHPMLLRVAHHLLGVPLFYMGEVAAARTHLEQSLVQYDPGEMRALPFRRATDFGVVSLSHLSWALWLLGYPEQACAKLHAACALAQELSHPPSINYTLHFASGLYQYGFFLFVLNNRVNSSMLY
jgi:hypothetical protein